MITYIKEIDSTNTELKRRAIAGAPSGTVLVADRQTAGRGRMGRQFFSPDGAGLYMSVLARPVILSQAGRMTHLVAVAVRRALLPLGVDADIKWVNDLLVGGRKLCGILVESGMASGETFAVIGIGINLAHAAFPEELAPIVTSVEDVTGSVPERAALVEAILAELRPLMGPADEAVEAAMDEYRRRCITVGKPVIVLPHGAEGYPAVALGVNPDGSLRVVLPDGTRRDIATGEVSVRMGENQS